MKTENRRNPGKRGAGGLTPKQERFAVLYLQLGNASEAYRRSYDAKGVKAESVNRLAYGVLKNVKVASRIEELRAALKVKAGTTLEELIEELQAAYKLAMTSTKSVSAAVSAVHVKAKLLGLDVKKVEGKFDLNERDPLTEELEAQISRAKKESAVAVTAGEALSDDDDPAEESSAP